MTRIARPKVPAGLQRRLTGARWTTDLHWAVAKTAWGSLTRYARDRFGVTQSTFSSWVIGTSACPREVANIVRADFPRLRWSWPGGLTDRPPIRRVRTKKKKR